MAASFPSPSPSRYPYFRRQLYCSSLFPLPISRLPHPMRCDGRLPSSQGPPRFNEQFLPPKSISVSAAAAYGQSVNGAAILSRLDARCQPEIGGASEGATRRPARPRAVFPSANCPLPPSIFYVLSVSRVRPSSLSGRSPPSFPASPNSASSQRRSLPPPSSLGWPNLRESRGGSSSSSRSFFRGCCRQTRDRRRRRRDAGRPVNAGK